MTPRKYIIGTGYSPTDRYDYKAFLDIWYNRVMKLYGDVPIYILEQGADIDIGQDMGWDPTICKIGASNLGHVHTLIDDAKAGKQTHQLCGWSAGILALAMIAYNNCADLVVIEQDCLVFGDVIGQAYRDMGNDGQMVFGSCRLMGVAQSFFVIKHEFIPRFCQYYLSLWTDSHTTLRPEDKFKRLEAEYGSKIIKRLSFGLDRDRPIDYDAPIFYVQHLTPDELAELKRRNMI